MLIYGIINNLKWILTQTNLHYWLLPSWVEGFSYTSDDDEDDLDYTDDYENSPFDSYGENENLIPTLNEKIPEQSVNNINIQPEIVYPVNVNPSPGKRFSSNNSSPRPCDKRVFLYNLQPDRLNTSGIFNPLKGKLTNCHASGCER